MSKRQIFIGASALAVLGGAAFADVTAPQIWAEWQQIQTSLGTSMTAGGQTYSGGVLTLTDVQTVSDLDGDVTRGRYDQIVMQEQADGTVRIVVSPVYALSTVGKIGNAETVTTMEIRTDNQTLVAGGDDQTRTYNGTVGRMVMELGETMLNGRAQDSQLLVVMQDQSYALSHGVGDGAQPYQGSGAVAGVDFTMNFAEPNGATNVDVAYTYTGLSAELEGTFGGGDGGGVKDFVSFAALGVTALGGFSHESTTFDMTVEDQNGPSRVSGTSGPGTTTLEFTPTRVGVSSSTQDTKLSGTMAMMPIPVDLTIGQADFALSVPMALASAPQDMSVKLALRDMALSESLWSLFDPTRQISRAPATIAIDLQGTMTPKVDFFQNTKALETMSAPPADINSARINELLVELGGARLTGRGDVRFNNTGGVPDPLGKLTFQLDGGFALLDKLVAAGLIPEGDATGMRMMSGMVARPTGADRLESVIEFTPGGGIVANGFPIQ